jgi:hypothetical protein
MSTKIYDAYHYTGPRLSGFHGLFALSNSIREAMLPVSRRLTYTEIGAKLADIVDIAVLEKVCDPDRANISPAALLVNAHFDANKRRQEEARQVDWDMGFEWTFICVRRRLLLKVFGNQPMVEMFEHIFGEIFADYHYQNSTDRPSRITARAWGRRRDDWDLALKGASFAECGFSANLFGTSSRPSPLEIDECLAVVPPVEARAERRAKDWFLTRFTRERVTAKDAPLSAYVEAMDAWVEESKKPDNQKALAEKQLEFKGKLPVLNRAIVSTPLAALYFEEQGPRLSP